MPTRSVRSRLGIVLSISLLSCGCGNAKKGPETATKEPVPDAAPNGGSAGMRPDSPDQPEVIRQATCEEQSVALSTTAGWQSKDATDVALSSLRVEVIARPASEKLDGLFAIGNGDIDDFSNAAIAVRFADTGEIDVRDGDDYRSDAEYQYVADVWYTISILANVAAGTYDVEVGACGETLTKIISGASFRTDADVKDQLNSWAAWSSQAAALEIAEPQWDASGKCEPSTCESLDAQCGNPGDGCGTQLSCGDCPVGERCDESVCVDDSSPVLGGGPNPDMRGPTGQWPEDFPAYGTKADIVTDGTDKGLEDALGNAECTAGCVIEHPGNVSNPNMTRAGDEGQVLVRPPIGKRADFTIGGTHIKDNDLMVAGYMQTGGLWVDDVADNSGFGWIEADAGSSLIVQARGGDVNAFMYELVYREYRGADFADRIMVQSVDDAHSTLLMVGSIITGGQCPATDGCHADAIQAYNTGAGSSYITLKDSVVWPSWDKGIQGIDDIEIMTLDNVMLISPSEAKKLAPQLDLSDNNITSNAAGVMRNSTLVGGIHPNFPLKTSNSEFWNTIGNPVDEGGNVELSERPIPPAAPTHEQLDVIWSP